MKVLPWYPESWTMPFRLQCVVASTIAISLSGVGSYVRERSPIEVFR